MGDPAFGRHLAGLLARRGLAVDAVGVPEAELRSVVDGAAVEPSLLRRLAPVLGLHTADLFVIAGLVPPDDLAPTDPHAWPRLGQLMREAVALSPVQLNELRRAVAELPQLDGPSPVTHVRHLDSSAPGAIPMRLLGNRNVSPGKIAPLFLEVTGRYWSVATYHVVGVGRKELTPDLLYDFWAMLDVPGEDLAAMTGVPLPDRPAPPAAIGGLLWDVRRLTAEQLEQVLGLAKAARQTG